MTDKTLLEKSKIDSQITDDVPRMDTAKGKINYTYHRTNIPNCLVYTVEYKLTCYSSRQALKAIEEIKEKLGCDIG